MPLPDWVKNVSWKLGEGKRGRRKIKEDRNVGSFPLVRKIQGLEREDGGNTAACGKACFSSGPLPVIRENRYCTEEWRCPHMQVTETNTKCLH